MGGEEVTEGVVMVRSGGMVEGGGWWDALHATVVGAGEAVVKQMVVEEEVGGRVDIVAVIPTAD